MSMWSGRTDLFSFLFFFILNVIPITPFENLSTTQRGQDQNSSSRKTKYFLWAGPKALPLLLVGVVSCQDWKRLQALKCFHIIGCVEHQLREICI